MYLAEVRKVLNSYLEQPIVRMLVRMGVTPNLLTIVGLVTAGVSSYLISIGNLWAGGIVLLLSGAFDIFDGGVARYTGLASRFGALLDSIVDRVSEVIVLLGLLIFYVDQSSSQGIILVYLTLSGSILVSYLRARAEGLGIECKVGVMQRPERVVSLGIGVIVGWWWPPFILIILAGISVLTIVTTTQRIIHASKALESKQ